MLNTDNKNNFIFEYEDVLINVRGGLNDNNQDSLGVTLKIQKQDSYRNCRETINLSNGNQTEKLIVRVSEQLEIHHDTLRGALSELADELEDYRDNNQLNDNRATTSYSLSEVDEEEALKFLKSPDLMIKTNKLIGQSGIVGEEINRLLMYLIFTSRITNKPLHCISFGSSGVGKTHLQSKVSQLIPNEDKIEITQLTPKALYHFTQYQLMNKIILIEDMEALNSESLLAIREIQSKGKISKASPTMNINGHIRTYNKVVEGPVCISGCTTQESIYEDNANRSFLIYIDESTEQDERIMAYQRKKYAGKINEGVELQSIKQLKNTQRLLKQIKVINPFAEHLILPKQVFKPRRTNLHWLQLIEVITFYHQFQREKHRNEITGEEYIETTLEDIQWSVKLIKDVLLRKSDTLNRVTRDYFESLKKFLSVKNTKIYNNREIRKELRIDESTLRRYHRLLINEGYIKKRDDIKGDSFHYEVLDINEFEALETAIEKALQTCIDLVSSSEVRQS